MNKRRIIGTTIIFFMLLLSIIPSIATYEIYDSIIPKQSNNYFQKIHFYIGNDIGESNVLSNNSLDLISAKDMVCL